MTSVSTQLYIIPIVLLLEQNTRVKAANYIPQKSVHDSTVYPAVYCQTVTVALSYPRATSDKNQNTVVQHTRNDCSVTLTGMVK